MWFKLLVCYDRMNHRRQFAPKKVIIVAALEDVLLPSIL